MGPTDPASLALALGWGGLIGVVYFGGLWLSLRGLAGRARPRAAFAAAYVVRLSLALAGFWSALALGPLALAASMVGFVAVRGVMVRRLGAGVRAWK
ncbi:F1F0 ATPase subunit 2 [Desulfobaculum xiamenense]|uniref:F1F0 ATPase subunit 2 n=1 Tax=Desulfobaculum xiamenense TaxID=995050 RepID=A0A846QLL0_9BACT|nr:ATP synthase subunit I [Desulfobaculum xiamenense]NJB68077.1 F1F0 ATPase subunit 2 [Desulfobaculum xiamenense]